MNKKILSLLVICFCFLTQISFGQSDDKRTKIEITVKDGNKTITVPIRSATVSFTKGTNYKDPEDKTDNRSYYFSLDFEKQDINLLRAFATSKNGLDGQITMVDTYGKTPARKFEFKGAKLDSLSDQLTGDYSSSYFSLYCSLIIIDGVTIQ
ncbi:hypothetical protein L1276_004838 [Flavobacterium sp. HSC-32F16]|uniref:hypothetical protein n=1 Tax=Flavobacterium sp. HSC-32F16 TaxID=2910964 RepID=UPI0020A3A618|nr:hypothetical protein [Flavobacterium sp. HSC-32F16]MCP2029644.1 hypothetical protein [Flavobacterium sp. HSC-32F16]